MKPPAQNRMTPEQIREVIHQSGFTLVGLAAELGVHRNTVTNVLSGLNKGRRGKARKVAEAFGWVESPSAVPGAKSARDALENVLNGGRNAA